MEYPKAFKERIVKKALGMEMTQEAFVKAHGISRSSLQKWLRDARRGAVTEVAKNTEKRPQDWSAQERFAALVESSALAEQERGAWCRRHGLHSHHLQQWKRDAIAGSGAKACAQDKAQMRKLREQNRRLNKELRRKDKALAETSALLVLKKKAHLIWGDDEDD
jgi:transposase-like protein